MTGEDRGNFNKLRYYKIKIITNHIKRRLGHKIGKIVPFGPLILVCITTITLLASIIGFNVLVDATVVILE